MAPSSRSPSVAFGLLHNDLLDNVDDTALLEDDSASSEGSDESEEDDAPSVDFCVVEALRFAEPNVGRSPFATHYMAGRGLAHLHWRLCGLSPGELRGGDFRLGVS